MTDRLDTRSLFESQASRKASYWHHVRTPSTHFFTEERLEALLALPRVYVEDSVTPFSDIFVNEDGIEHLLIVETDEDEPPYVFYVNTEGFTYARYSLRVPDAVAESMLPSLFHDYPSSAFDY